MQTDCNSDRLSFESFDGRRIVAAFDGGAITSNAGALLLRHTNKAIDLFDRVAACFSDQRDQGQVVHGLPALVGQRIAGIALGYEDSNHTTISSPCAARPGTSSSISRGKSCPSGAENGRMGSDQRKLVLQPCPAPEPQKPLTSAPKPTPRVTNPRLHYPHFGIQFP